MYRTNALPKGKRWGITFWKRIYVRFLRLSFWKKKVLEYPGNWGTFEDEQIIKHIQSIDLAKRHKPIAPPDPIKINE